MSAAAAEAAPRTGPTPAPAAEADIAEQVRAAAADGAPLEIVGGGSRLGLGRPVNAERNLSTAPLSAIDLYEPGALTLVAQAGAPMAQIEATLAAEGQRLPFEPIDHRALLGTEDKAPTIGGVVACGVAGPRRIQAGACRDSLIGVRFVNGAGEAVSSGGRVMKNVTGYDLVKLMAGAYGTLGVLTQVSFKLLPMPERAATLRLTGLSDASGVAALSAGLGSPYDVTGAAHTPGGETAAAQTLLRLEGFADSVAYRAAALRDRLAERFAAEAEAIEILDDADGLWADLRDVRPFVGREGAVWRVSLKPTDAPAFVSAVRRELPVEAFYDWGGGLVWLLAPEAGDAGARIIRNDAAQLGGVATLVRASPAVRAAVAPFPPQPGPLAALAQGLKARFDPAGILNPGRMTA